MKFNIKRNCPLLAYKSNSSFWDPVEWLVTVGSHYIVFLYRDFNGLIIEEMR